MLIHSYVMVLPMQACHLLLGRLWQHDNKVHHDGYTNKHTLLYQGKTITIKPMTPLQIAEAAELKIDQAKSKPKGQGPSQNREQEQEPGQVTLFAPRRHFKTSTF